LLIKNLYGILRDEGNSVDTVDHPAAAVKKVIWGRYDYVIVDSEPFGMSAEDAVKIIRAVAPDMPILFVGRGRDREGSKAEEEPLDLEEFKRRLHGIAV
jgi:DNA-binding response OmpR family regulator